MPKKTIDDIESLVTIDQFIEKMCLKSRTTAYRWIKQGTLKTAKVGRRRMIPLSEVARLSKAKFGL